MTRDLVVGIDVGSQGTCAQLVRAADGELLATAYEGYDVRYPRPGWAEQDPGAWLAAIGRTVREATGGVDAQRVAAGGTPLVVITDSPFSPLLPPAKAWFEVVEEDFEGFRPMSATLALAMALAVGTAERRGAR